jgi:CDGSH-type Zn-finger protein
MSDTRQITDAAIEVGENGPYRVTGGVPLVRVSKVETEQGEPIAWHVDEVLDAPAEYLLCRCGNSDNKPFCSDMHDQVGFDGTESAPTDAYGDRAKTLGGTEVTIRDDRGICTHASFCANRITNVWKAAKKIDEDPALRDQIVAMVSRCPSGALSYAVDGTQTEPELPVQIAAQKDGPLLVTGRIRVQRSDGESFEIRNRVALCRCGNSSIKPLCDGTHKEIGFTD